MKKILHILMLLVAAGLTAQKLPREVLNGQLFAAETPAEDILVTNRTANSSVVSKKDGTFQIPARVKDTLMFSGINFPKQILVLNDADLRFKVLKISIESQPTNLDEVIINPKALSGNLLKDAENIKVAHLYTEIDNLAAIDKLYFDDEKSSPDNKLMPGYLDPTYMTDFAKLGGKLIRSIRRSDAKKIKNRDVSRFSVVVQNRFSDDFFRNMLKVQQSELVPFLNFCESDPLAKETLEHDDDFELIRFLEVKKQEYRALKKE